MSVIGTPLLLGEEATGYQISRSVRLRSSASAYLTRTLSSNSTSQTKMTWSGWVKRGTLGSALRNCVFYVGNSGATSTIIFAEFFNDSFRVLINGGATVVLTTTQVFRDPSAWYHIVFAYDSTQATSSDRMKLYVNGVQVTAFNSAAYPALNATINNVATTIQQFANVASVLFDGYLAEQHFVDGEGLAASSFGEFDIATGVWKPKRYAGTYGTNGFYLDFSDNSAATAAAIGKDWSGNGNNFTPNNISVTSGVTYDSMLDTPTPYADGGNGRGNYAVINPLAVTPVAATIAEGNLKVTTGLAGGNGFGSIAIPSSGKWYWEITVGSTYSTMIGIADYSATQTYAWQSGNSVFYYGNAGQKYVDGSASTYGATYTTNDVIGIAVDADTGTVTFYKNNATQGAITHAVAGLYPCLADGGSAGTDTYYANFGQRPFAYTPPTGFKALNTQNLPDATIKKGADYFDVTTYTGNGSSQSVVNRSAMQPDLVWVKSRSNAYNNLLFDAVRGAGKVMFSNATNIEGGNAGDLLGSFNSNGFSVNTTFGAGADPSSNGNALTYVGWQWKESASAGFDIVTWTGDGTSSRNINHSLGVAPKMIISKSRTLGAGDAGYWDVYHASLAAQNTLFLHTTGAAVSAPTIWPSAPTSTYFTVGSGSGVNVSGSTMVAYLFAEVAGFSKFGSYTGNGSADGPFVYCGFRPRYVMIKESSSTGSWVLLDTSRSPYNASNNASLWANLADAEGGASAYLDILSNGFKIRDTDSDKNTNSSTYIYACFAENPFKNSLAR